MGNFLEYLISNWQDLMLPAGMIIFTLSLGLVMMSHRASTFLMGFGFIFTVIGTSYLIISVLLPIYNWYQMQSWEPVSAELSVLTWPQRNSKRYNPPRATYKYVYNGKSHTGNRIAYSDYRLNKNEYVKKVFRRISSGQKIQIYVNPENPTDAIINRDLFLRSIGFAMVFFSGFGGFGVWMLATAFRFNKSSLPLRKGKIQHNRKYKEPEKLFTNTDVEREVGLVYHQGTPQWRRPSFSSPGLTIALILFSLFFLTASIYVAVSNSGSFRINYDTWLSISHSIIEGSIYVLIVGIPGLTGLVMLFFGFHAVGSSYILSVQTYQLHIQHRFFGIPIINKQIPIDSITEVSIFNSGSISMESDATQERDSIRYFTIIAKTNTNKQYTLTNDLTPRKLAEEAFDYFRDLLRV